MNNDRMDGVKLLGLSSGGGQQMPIFAAIGADCTLLDCSDKQLDNDRMVLQREGYEINIIKADTTKEPPFEDEAFDVVFSAGLQRLY
jgi:ubiquinone/menaquinone biosynthesis C-methylase UbiE